MGFHVKMYIKELKYIMSITITEKSTLKEKKIENLEMVKDVLWPYILFGIVLGCFVTEIFHRNDENYLIILLIFCIGPTVIMCYLRRFSSFGLFISSNMVVYRFRECEKKIKWENLYIETILETNLPYPRKKFYFRDLKNPTNDFKYEMNQPTRKKFIKMLTKYFPANHEIFKKV